MTSKERAELAERLAAVPVKETALALIMSALFFGVGSFTLLKGAVVLSARLLHWPIAGYARPIAVTGAALVLVWVLLDDYRRHRWRQARLRLLQSDLDHGRIEEDRAEVTGLHRFQEPEHFTEFLVFTCTDGRLRAVLDDSTFGEEPRRSTLKLGRQMTALRFPASGTELTRFAGEPLRRPKAIPSDPRTWPDEGWITPDALARIDGHSGTARD